MKRALAVTAFFCLIAGCEESFNPVQDYRDQLVVYSILYTYSDTQYVRVQSTYNAPGHNPLNQTDDTPVSGATVRMDGVSTTFWFTDTLLTRPSGSRYISPILAYYNGTFRPVRGAQYLLEVVTPLGSALATVRVPGPVHPYSSDFAVMQAPHLYPPTKTITLRAALSPFTHAYFFRLFLDYEVAVPGGWKAHEIEIPFSLVRSDTIDMLEGFYPSLQLRSTNPQSTASPPDTDRQTYYQSVYFRVIQLLREKYPPGFIQFLRARLVLYQTDKDFYTYSRVVSGFNDSKTVRTDEPDFTNITGGRGLFGVIAKDTTTYFVVPHLGL